MLYTKDNSSYGVYLRAIFSSPAGEDQDGLGITQPPTHEEGAQISGESLSEYVMAAHHEVFHG